MYAREPRVQFQAGKNAYKILVRLHFNEEGCFCFNIPPDYNHQSIPYLFAQDYRRAGTFASKARTGSPRGSGGLKPIKRLV